MLFEICFSLFDFCGIPVAGSVAFRKRQCVARAAV